MKRRPTIALAIGFAGAAASLLMGVLLLLRLQGDLGRLAEAVSLEPGAEASRLRWLAAVMILAGLAGAAAGTWVMRQPRASAPAWVLLMAGLIPALLSGLAWAGLLMTLSGAILLGERSSRGTAAD